VSKSKKPTTSFRLDPELVRQARRYALDHDTSVSAMIEDALRRVFKLQQGGCE
jgi:predicted transcriptional regulator